MRKLVTLSVFLLAWISQAQISQGNSLINVHIGFGLTSKISTTDGLGISIKQKTIIPPVGLSYEYAVQDNITVGAFGAYSTQQLIMKSTDPYDSSNDFTMTTDLKYTFFGGLANYHFNFIDNKNFDVYAGVLLGYLSFSGDVSTSGDSSFPTNLLSTDISGMVFGGQFGTRYFFSNNLAAHLILGYGVSYVNLGITYKLGV